MRSGNNAEKTSAHAQELENMAAILNFVLLNENTPFKFQKEVKQTKKNTRRKSWSSIKRVLTITV